MPRHWTANANITSPQPTSPAINYTLPNRRWTPLTDLSFQSTDVPYDDFAIVVARVKITFPKAPCETPHHSFYYSASTLRLFNIRPKQPHHIFLYTRHPVPPYSRIQYASELALTDVMNFAEARSWEMEQIREEVVKCVERQRKVDFEVSEALE